MARHLHLDLLGGMAGDMFIGAVLDAFPGLAEGLNEALAQAGFPGLVALDCRAHSDGVLTGTRFSVSPLEGAGAAGAGAAAAGEAAAGVETAGGAKAAAGGHGHQHRHYSDIKRLLAESSLAPAALRVAQDIFLRLAEAEARVHGKPVAEVAFHEVGAWDSIADIILAAHLIAALDATWSCSAAPTGSGIVETQHGKLPVPAPATSLLLEGFPMHDDGVPGERVTPTGAAILASLSPARLRPPGVMGRQGHGFGARRLAGVSNVLRLTVCETAGEADAAWQMDEVCRLTFEVDDMTPENLALALDRLRQLEGVLDVAQTPYLGKKRRQGASLSLLARPEAEARALAQIFAETSSLGVRRERLQRAVLPRREYQVAVDGKRYPVKVAQRPGGLTAKADMDALAATGLGLAEREALRARLEASALQQAKNDFAE